MTRRLLQMSWVCHPEHSRHAAACMPSRQKALVLSACKLPAHAPVPQAQRQHAHEWSYVLMCVPQDACIQARHASMTHTAGDCAAGCNGEPDGGRTLLL